MPILTLRGCDTELDLALKNASKRRGISVNRLILESLRAVFLGQGKKTLRHDDLDDLAGTWSVAEAAEFDAELSPFDAIDAELWTQ